MSRVTTPTTGVELFYEITGVGDEWVTFIHGGLVDARSWGEVPSRTGDRARVLVYDSRGFGRSDRPSGNYSVPEFVGDLCGLWDAVGIERSHLIGFSQGGVTAQATTIEAPERVSSMMLVGTFAYRADAERAVAKDRASAALRDGIGSQLETHVERVFAPGFATRHPETVKTYLAPFLDNDPSSFAQTMVAMSEIDLRPQLGSVRVPTTVVVGEHDRAVGVDHARRLYELIPGARLVIVPGVGHTVHIEAPDVFIDVVATHLDWAKQSRRSPKATAPDTHLGGGESQ
jgi:pimeloyl-ACP methyl ester carboxylesterase